MSAPKPKEPTASLYERDFFLWTTEQAEALRRAAHEGSNAPLDWENLAEEIESLGNSDKRGVQSRISQIIIHLWKLACSPAVDRKAKWRREIESQRKELHLILADSPSLRARADEFVAVEFKYAERVVKASLEDHGEFERAKADFNAFKSRGLVAEELLTSGLFPADSVSAFENAFR
jgi:hypothetical protein